MNMSDTIHKGKISRVTRFDEEDGHNGYSLEYDGGGCCLMDEDNPLKIEPKEGDSLIVRCVGFSHIRGMDLNGVKVFYNSDEKIEQRRIESRKKAQEKKEREFKENKSDMDARYEALPPIFKERLDKFRANNEDFRVDYESYELFCCEQALVIAKSCETKEKIQEFGDMDWKEQKELVPDLADGHSGNTFGCSLQLAYQYLNNPENIVKMNGALAPLVGSKEYGDVPVEED
jgi:hypothetical protein